MSHTVLQITAAVECKIPVTHDKYKPLHSEMRKGKAQGFVRTSVAVCCSSKGTFSEPDEDS